MNGAKRMVGAVLALGLALLAAGPAQAQVAGKQDGYIEMADGVGLKYTVLLPEGQGPFPVLLQYQGYGAGADPNDNGISLISPRLLAAGFAILGVSLRGTGCSEGSFDLFEDQWIADGLEVIRWAALQPWSNGDLAMIGLSFPGMTQMMIGPMRAPAVKALLPWSAMTDLYRDVGYPGGLFNVSFATGWTAIQKSGYSDTPVELSEGDTRCAAAIAGHNDPERIVFLFGQTHPWADNSIYERFVPEGSIGQINVPTLVSHAWQDEQISSRVTVDYEQLDPERTWMIYGNGAHGFGLGSKLVGDTAEAFLRHFLKGEDNGFERTPRVQIEHENAFGQPPRWISTYPRWPVETRLAELYLTPDGTLQAARPEAQGRFDYVYPLPAPSMTSAVAASQENQTYTLPVPPGGAAVFTTPALAHDLEVLGAIRADLWLSSTATDTDIQLSLTEVRPDGMEQFVQRGWLRASHRKMDLRHTRADQPYHLHTEADVLPLTPGQPVPLSMEIWSVNHVFRAGSALRLRVEAPLGTTGFRQLELNPTPAINTVHVGGATLSRITLPVLPGAQAGAALAACSGFINQPCRAASPGIPAGSLSVPAAEARTPASAGSAALVDGKVLLRNRSAETHYLRAVSVQLPDAQEIFEARLGGDAGVSIREPFAQTRFELPEQRLEPGASIELPLQIEPRRLVASLRLGNVAHAADGPPSASTPVGLLLWLALSALLLAYRRSWASAALLASGLMVACNQSSPIAVESRAEASAETTGLRLLGIEVVNDRGEFQRYDLQP
jgi:uncharacterized protein